MIFDKIIRLWGSIGGKVAVAASKKIIDSPKEWIGNLLGASDVKYPTLASNMNAGGAFFDLEFDDKTGKPTSVRYRDPSGQEYYYNYIHKKWFRI